MDFDLERAIAASMRMHKVSRERGEGRLERESKSSGGAGEVQRCKQQQGRQAG